MENVMINAGIVAVALIAIFWQFSHIKHQLFVSQMQQSAALDHISLLLTELQTSLKSMSQNKDQIEANTIKALNEICQALNSYFTTAGAYMNNSGFALQNIAVCMIPFMDGIKEDALKNEDYEKAQECVNVINNLKQILK